MGVLTPVRDQELGIHPCSCSASRDHSSRHECQSREYPSVDSIFFLARHATLCAFVQGDFICVFVASVWSNDHSLISVGLWDMAQANHASPCHNNSGTNQN